MKKVIAAILAVALFSVCFAACEQKKTAPPTEEETQTSIAFEENIYETGIGHAVQTKVKTENADTVTYASDNPAVATVSETGAVTGVAAGSAVITATAKPTEGDKSVSAQCTVNVNPSSYETLNGNEPLVKWLGRNFTAAGSVNCYNTASGLEISFYGTGLSATISAAGEKTPQLCVLTDGETDPAENVIDLTKTKATEEYVLVEDLPEGKHTARVLKITEAMTTSVGFVSLETDGYFLSRPADREYKIEVYGDSISAGHKNMRTTAAEPPDSTDKIQNGCLTYAWLAAEELNADVSVIARTGIGIYSAWGNPFVMKDNWNKTYLSEDDFLGTGYGNPVWEGDHAADAVLVNLGTNDVWYQWDAEKYEEEMIKFCEDLIEYHGKDAQIVLIYGMMVSDNKDALRNASMRLRAAGNKNVTLLELPKSAQGHPRLADNTAAAKVLADHLKDLL